MKQRRAISETFREIVEIVGLDPAIALAETFGGLMVYVPSNPSEDSEIVGVISREQAILLGQKFGGTRLYIPKQTDFLIAHLHQNGWAPRDIARRLRLSERAVYQNLARPDPKRGLKQLDMFGE